MKTLTIYIFAILLTSILTNPDVAYAWGINKKLLKAISEDRSSEVEQLLHKGADENAKERNGDTALIIATRGRNTDVVKLLINADADVNANNNIGDTALIVASKGGKADVVELLIEAGADVNAKGKAGSAVMVASNMGNYDIVKLLLEAGADVTEKELSQITKLEKARNAIEGLGFKGGREWFLKGADSGQIIALREGMTLREVNSIFTSSGHIYAGPFSVDSLSWQCKSNKYFSLIVRLGTTLVFHGMDGTCRLWNTSQF